MKRVGIAILITILSAAASTNAQTAAVDPEVDAIRAVADAYVSGDPAKLRAIFLPTSNLYTTDANGALRTIPFSEYIQRVSGNSNAPSEERKSSIVLVERTGKVAIVKITTIRPQVRVTDYLSLVQIENQWKVVNKAFFVEPRSLSSSEQDRPQVVMASPCTESGHHRFDFMIGTWQTTDLGSPTVAAAEGHSTVEPTLDGCIVHEHRSLTRQGKRLFDGDAYWGYDSTTKHWLLLYMDDQSHMQVYEGREEAGHLAFYRERPDPDGKIILIRIVYSPDKTSGYKQIVERSSDHGATWQPGGVTTYQSKR